MSKPSVDADFLASVSETIAHANKVGVQCSIVWRISDEDFTCASTLNSSAMRAMLTEARNVLSKDDQKREQQGEHNAKT